MGDTKRYRTKSIDVEARPVTKAAKVQTWEGPIHVLPGDWIVTRKGVQYAVSGDEFARNYEEAPPPPASAPQPPPHYLDDETAKLDRYLSGLDWHAGISSRHPPIRAALKAAFEAGAAAASAPLEERVRALVWPIVVAAEFYGAWGGEMKHAEILARAINDLFAAVSPPASAEPTTNPQRKD